MLIIIGVISFVINKKELVKQELALKENYPEKTTENQIKKSDYFGLYNRSKHTANIKFAYTVPVIKTDINLRVFYRSKYGMFDTNGNQILDKYDKFVSDYFITNLSISKYIGDKFMLQAGANNLLDFTDPSQISNLAGRQLFARIQYNF